MGLLSHVRDALSRTGAVSAAPCRPEATGTPGLSRVEIDYRRGPRHRRLYVQELLYRARGYRITLHCWPEGAGSVRVAEDLVLEPGAPLLWFTYPGRPYEVASFHDSDGERLGFYTNLVRPSELEGPRWVLHDLWLDVWQPAAGEPRILDRDELAEAEEEGWITPGAARGVRELAARILERAARGGWPPEEVRRTPLASVPALRFRRDRPGAYHANLLTGRIVAYGIYLLGAVSLTTLAFAALTGAPGSGSPARRWWLLALAAEAVGLFPFALTGRLPATRWARPGEAITERTLALAAVVTGAAVLFLYDSHLWRGLLGGIYAVLAVFSGIFTVSRAWFDRRVSPWASLTLVLSAAAVVLLL